MRHRPSWPTRERHGVRPCSNRRHGRRPLAAGPWPESRDAPRAAAVQGDLPLILLRLPFGHLMPPPFLLRSRAVAKSWSGASHKRETSTACTLFGRHQSRHDVQYHWLAVLKRLLVESDAVEVVLGGQLGVVIAHRLWNESELIVGRRRDFNRCRHGAARVVGSQSEGSQVTPRRPREDALRHAAGLAGDVGLARRQPEYDVDCARGGEEDARKHDEAERNRRLVHD